MSLLFSLFSIKLCSSFLILRWLFDRLFRGRRNTTTTATTTTNPNLIRVVDKGYASLWSATDETDFDSELERVRRGKITALTFEEKIERYRNDQTSRFEKSGKIVEPLHLGEWKEDLVVNQGLALIAALVAGKSNASIGFMASGTGAAGEQASDVRLANENARVSMITSGFIESTGTVIKMAGKFSTTLTSAMITESGSFTSGAINTGIMFHRTVYQPAARVQHMQNRTFYSILQSINQISVT